MKASKSAEMCTSCTIVPIRHGTARAEPRACLEILARCLRSLHRREIRDDVALDVPDEGMPPTDGSKRKMSNRRQGHRAAFRKLLHGATSNELQLDLAKLLTACKGGGSSFAFLRGTGVIK